MTGKMKGSHTMERVIAKVSADVLAALEKDQAPESWPRFMDVRTTALYLDKSESCIRNWIREGVIPVVHLSTLHRNRRHPVFVDRYALDKLLTVKN